MKKILFMIYVSIGLLSIMLFIGTIELLNAIPFLLLAFGVFALCTAICLCDKEYINKYIQDEEDDENGYI